MRRCRFFSRTIFSLTRRGQWGVSFGGTLVLMPESWSYWTRTAKCCNLPSNTLPTSESRGYLLKSVFPWPVNANLTFLTRISTSALLNLSSFNVKTQASAVRNACYSCHTPSSFTGCAVWLSITMRTPCMRVRSTGSNLTTWSYSFSIHLTCALSSATGLSLPVISSSNSTFRSSQCRNTSMMRLSTKSSKPCRK